MGCAYAPAGVAIKILVKVNIVAKLVIVLQFRILRIYLAFADRILEEYPGKAICKLLGNLIDAEIPPCARGTLDLEVISVIVVELLQRLDDQEVDGEPHGATPVGVTSEQARPGLIRLVVQLERVAVHPIRE